MLTRLQIDAAHKRLIETALAGARCPFNTTREITGGIPQVAIAYLARGGLIKVDIYAQNWRVVTLLTGEHSGKHTALPPFKNLGPYKTIDTGTTLHRRVARLRQDRSLSSAQRSEALNRRLFYAGENRERGTDEDTD